MSEAAPRVGRPVVFLDRDGTLVEEVADGYVRTLDALRLYPWAAGAVRRLNDAGLPVVVVTNQSGVARGYFDEAFLARAHAELNARLAEAGARIDAFYHCPHLPEATGSPYGVACECRKPKPGMLLSAARDLGVDLGRSWMVGDTWRDIRCGRSAGTRTVLVTSGQGHAAAAAPPGDLEPDTILPNLMEAVEWILRNDSARW